jgi:hypothetical protein
VKQTPNKHHLCPLRRGSNWPVAQQNSCAERYCTRYVGWALSQCSNVSFQHQMYGRNSCWTRMMRTGGVRLTSISKLMVPKTRMAFAACSCS